MSIVFSKKFIFKSLALAAVLGAVSGVACAQSAEFRLGYDQGYRDGVESQEHRDHGGPAGRIIIEEARYGSREVGVCNARDTIQQMVGWRRHADIRVGNELCGDPAKGYEKHLHVRYRCGDSPSAEAEAPENAVLELSCR